MGTKEDVWCQEQMLSWVFHLVMALANKPETQKPKTPMPHNKRLTNVGAKDELVL